MRSFCSSFSVEFRASVPISVRRTCFTPSQTLKKKKNPYPLLACCYFCVRSKIKGGTVMILISLTYLDPTPEHHRKCTLVWLTQYPLLLLSWLFSQKILQYFSLRDRLFGLTYQLNAWLGQTSNRFTAGPSKAHNLGAYVCTSQDV